MVGARAGIRNKLGRKRAAEVIRKCIGSVGVRRALKGQGLRRQLATHFLNAVHRDIDH